MTAKTGQRGQKSLGQECLGRTAGEGQLGKDNWVRTTGTGQLVQISLDKKAGTGQPERTVRMVQTGRERADRVART
jgi:hypothetical protein